MAASKKRAEVNPERNGDSRGLPKNKQFLDTFWSLADTRDLKRVEGAERLIKFVAEKQRQHEADPSHNEGDSLYCTELSYTLTRLVKGLASPRKGARQGFSMALSELLRSVEEIRLEDVIARVNSNLKNKGKKQEEREQYFGQIFAYLAIIQSGRLTLDSQECSRLIFTELQGLSHQKTYLQDVCISSLHDLLSQVNQEVFSKHLWPILKPQLKEGWAKCTPARLALLLTSHRRFPEVVKPKFLEVHWETSSIFCEENYGKITQIMADSASISHPNVHGVCDEVLTLLTSDLSKLGSFWRRAVLAGLSESTAQRRHLSLLLSGRLLPRLHSDLPREVLKGPLIHNLMKALSNKTNPLHQPANTLAEQLVSSVASGRDGPSQVGVLQCLLQAPGSIYFDSITKSRTISRLTALLSAQGARLHLQWLRQLFRTGVLSRSEELDSDRQWVCSQLVHLVRTAGRQEDWVTDALDFLFLHAFFKVVTPDPSISQCDLDLGSQPASKEVQKHAMQAFHSVLTFATNMAPIQQADSEVASESSGKHKLLGTMTTGDLWVYHVVQYAQELLSSKSVVCAVEFDEESQASWERMLSTVEKIRKKAASRTGAGVASEAGAFQMLFLHIGLQLFIDSGQARLLLEELDQCYQRALQKRRSLKPPPSGERDGPDWMVVVTEVLLSLLSQSSHLLRSVVDTAFKMICPHMTQAALQLLLDTLDPKSSPLKASEEEEESEDEEDQDEEEGEDAASDDESANENEMNGDIQSGEEEDEDGEMGDSEDDGDSSSGGEDEEFRAQVKLALGSAAAAKSSDEEDSGAGSDSDADLSDSEMFQIDSALAQVFKERKHTSAKKKKMEAEQTLLHFKLRVLDLVDIYIKRQSSNPLVLELVHPLLLVIKAATGNQNHQVLAVKASSIYKNKLCRLRKYSHELVTQKESLHSLLDNLAKIALKAPSVHMVSLVSAGCLLVLKVLCGNAEAATPSPVKTRHQRAVAAQVKADPGPAQDAPPLGLVDTGHVIRLYARLLGDFMRKRESRLHPVLFTELIDRFPLIGWGLANTLVKYVTDGVQIYRRTQACVMLTTLLSRKAPSPQALRDHALLDSEQFGADLKETLEKALRGVSEESASVKHNHLLQLLQLLHQFVRVSHQAGASPDWSGLVELGQVLQDREAVSRSQEIKSAVASAINSMKNRNSDGSSGSGGGGGKKKRKRNKQNKRKRHSENSAQD